MKQNKNIHVVSTNTQSRLFYSGNNSELLFSKEPILFRTFERSPQNIYITSDEEPKAGDYSIATISGNIEVVQLNRSTCIYYDYKIILTTDQELIKDGVQGIDDEFLEWFVKNPSCKLVGVTFGCLEVRQCMCESNARCLKPGYEIIIPKEKL